jgi:hypothetical protein
MLFPTRFGELFKAVLCCSMFIFFKEKVMTWGIRRDFDDFTANGLLEEFLGNDF